MEKQVEQLSSDVAYIRRRLDSHIDENHRWQTGIAAEMGAFRAKQNAMTGLISAAVAALMSWLTMKFGG